MHVSKLKITTISMLAGVLLSGSALAALPADSHIRPVSDVASPLDAPVADDEITDLSDFRDSSSVDVEEMSPAEFAAVADLSVPSDFAFVLDPLNLSGNGQIQSGQYVFENNGSLDLEVTIETVYYQFPNDVDFKSIQSPELLDLGSPTKDLYLYLEQQPSQETGGEGIKTILTNNPEAASPVTFVLSADKSAPNNKAVFTLGGGASQGASIWWQDGDIQVFAVYTYTVYDADIIDLDELEANAASPLDGMKLEETEDDTDSSNKVDMADGPAGDIKETPGSTPESSGETSVSPGDSSIETTQPADIPSTEVTPPESSAVQDTPPASSEAPSESEAEKESASKPVEETEPERTEAATEAPETQAAAAEQSGETS